MNDEKKREIKLLRLSGLTVYQIAVKTGVPIADVLRVLDGGRS